MASKSPTTHQEPPHSILLTIDVEDWFQVENFKACIPFSSWSSCQLRVEKNTHALLDLFDSLSEKSASRIQCTFFVLGWIAERLPHLVRERHARGHEVASHGFYHELCSLTTDQELQRDLVDSKNLIEDIIGAPVTGYRAPSFSVSEDTLHQIHQAVSHNDKLASAVEMSVSNTADKERFRARVAGSGGAAKKTAKKGAKKTAKKSAKKASKKTSR